MGGHDDVARCDVLFERAGHADEEDRVGLERRDGAFGEACDVDVAFAGRGQGDKYVGIVGTAHFEDGAESVQVQVGAVESTTNGRVLQLDCREHHDRNTIIDSLHWAPSQAVAVPDLVTERDASQPSGPMRAGPLTWQAGSRGRERW